jgi:hypothetical protein
MAYVTAYARFFDETSTDCDKVSWHWYPWPVNWLSWQYLDVQRRKDMNELVDLVNAELRDAVGRAGSQFVFVEYDSYFGRLRGRYCLPSVQEPSPNRADLLFYLVSRSVLALHTGLTFLRTAPTKAQESYSKDKTHTRIPSHRTHLKAKSKP